MSESPEIETVTVNGLTIKLEYCNSGLWFATSPDRRGLIIAERSKELALARVPGTLKMLDEAKSKWDAMSPIEREDWMNLADENASPEKTDACG